MATFDAWALGLGAVDFEGDPGAALQTINGWVADRTRGRIPHLLRPDDVERQTRLILTNAVYFNGSWKERFPGSYYTAEERFATEEGKTTPVWMMKSREKFFDYWANEQFEAVSLRYKGDSLSMVIVLPKKRFGLEEVERDLTNPGMQQTIARLRPRPGVVMIPRWRFASEFCLNRELAAMGMPHAFSKDADFSALSEWNLYLHTFRHKATVIVDETGTEATAASAAGTNIRSGFAEKLFEFRADHPFLFLIRDQQTGSVLFIGRVKNPNG